MGCQMVKGNAKQIIQTAPENDILETSAHAKEHEKKELEWLLEKQQNCTIQGFL